MVTIVIINSYNIKKEKIMNSTLQKIVAKAKQLKKQAPDKFAKWTDYVKEASKQIKPVIKKAKKTAKKVIGYKKDRLAILKKTTPLIKKYMKNNNYSRKDAIKNANIDAGFLSGSHTDKNSHNVKLAIYSGVKLDFAKELIYYVKVLEEKQKFLLFAKNNIKAKNNVASNKESVKMFNSQIKDLKTHINQLKKKI